MYFMEHYSTENYSEAAEIGAQILLSDPMHHKKDERIRLLYKTIRSYAYAQEYSKAYKFISTIETSTEEPLFKKYIQLYKGIVALAVNKNQQSKEILTRLLTTENTVFLVDSVKAKIYHNLSIICGYEEQHTLKLDYLSKSFELEKKTLLSKANYENYNLSVEVFTSTLYNNYRQYEKAYHVFQEALALPFNQEINNHNHALYQNYIDLSLKMGMEEKVANNIKKLRSFYTDKPQYYQNEYANLLDALAGYYFEQNNYTNAILFANKALSITSINQRTKYIRNSANHILAGTYYDLQQLNQMKFYLRQNIKEIKQVDARLLAEAFLFAGQYHAKIFEDDAAYAYIDSAKTVYYRKLRLPLNRQFENTLALAYFDLEQYNQCLFHLENVENLLNSNRYYTKYLYWDNAYEKALCHNNLKHYKEAYHILKDVVSEMLSKYPHLQDKLSSIQDSRFATLYRQINIALANNLYHQYEVNKNVNHLKEALVCIEVAGRGLEQLRSKQNYDRDRLVTGELYYDFTLQSTKVAMALYKATEEEKYLHLAFSFIQKGKAYALLQGVNEKEYKLNSGIPTELLNAVNKAKKQYDVYLKRYNDALFSNQTDSSLISHLTSRMSATMGKIDSLNLTIKHKFPAYKEQKARMPYLDIHELQMRLGREQVIIDYYQTETELFRFTISKTSYRSDIIKLEQTFDEAIELVIAEASTPFYGQHSVAYIQKFASAAYSLYNILLGDIHDITKGKELIIVPHSKLSYLPFEILLTQNYSGAKPRFKEFPWLIKKHTVSYAYNTALLNYHSSEPVAFDRILAFAPKYSGKGNYEGSTLESVASLDTILPPLDGAEKEILSIEQNFRTKVFKGKNATRTNFIGAMQSNDILHLAMHSINDEIHPFNSQIVFNSQNNEAGSFTAAEIYNYSIKSPLTVLSSCSTGSGQRVNGEGLLSLARAFTFAGVQSQVMTLWPVHDASGAEITKGFYNELSNGIHKNKALQASKLHYLKNADGVHSHPYYWANYVLSGNTDPIQQKMPKGVFIYLLAFAMLSVIILFIYDKKHTR
ncbi:CHAT domain-containing protein [Carboxylicivirga taeanensis]|uniref:CHAT domain-containing protein n=1 Tax=Carboxylicivirga taeanensis TaxID=1416875 RepID=UPI003F6DB02A